LGNDPFVLASIPLVSMTDLAAANAGLAWIRLRKVDQHLTDAEAIAAATEFLRDDPGDYLPSTPVDPQ
jgi:hypothetical protein